MSTSEALLATARTALVQADVPTPALDARLLLQHVLDISHAELIASHTHPLNDSQAIAFERLIARRLAGEPVSRILATREFYGRSFKTSRAVLDPRPDTETLVDACLNYLSREEHQTVLDLGTGSGILAITVLAERPHNLAVACDISPAALAVAKSNAERWNVANRIAFIESDWFGSITGCFDLILSNPPYIPEPDIPGLEVEVRNHDPHIALSGGQDGLVAYRTIASGAMAHLNQNGIVAVEIGAGQQHDVTSIFAENEFYLLSSHQDLAGHVRCLLFRARAKSL